MRIWEVFDSPYDERRGGGRRGGSYNQHDSRETEAYECGMEDGYREAMKHVYGERTIRRSGAGLGREVYMRDDDMFDEDMYNMRRRRDGRGRFM